MNTSLVGEVTLPFGQQSDEAACLQRGHMAKGRGLCAD